MSRKETRQRALTWQIARLERQLARLQVLNNRFSWLRLGTFTLGALLSAGIMLTGALGWGFAALGLTLVAFSLVARQHRRITHSIQQHEGYLRIKRAHQARMTLDWASLPPTLITTPRPDHPVELDLDLVGEHGLHRLLDTCVSREGSIRLRDWLSTTEPDAVRIHARQQLVRELRPLAAFRDRLQLHAVMSTHGTWRRWDGQQVHAWLAAVLPENGSGRALAVLLALAACNVVLFALFALDVLAPWWVIPFMAYAGLYLWHVQRMGDPFELGLALRDPLSDLEAIFAFLERYPYGGSPALRTMAAPFLDAAQRPSMQLARLARVLAAASVRRNPLLWSIISTALPWDVIVMRWMEARRRDLSVLLPQWLDVWYTLEALSALANFGGLNPGYTFPTVLDNHAAAAQTPVFTARALGHPLIADRERVCNDVTLSQPGDLLLITGSNMSGKSTFLRTVGINLVLAYAGGPVTAEALHTVPLRLFTCIRVPDSLSDGISYFYAEVKRLKTLLVALQRAGGRPLLYLIDEIFRGTNNRERLIGSRSYIRAVAGSAGVGILSTHDLELVRLADDIPQITNMHFAETIADGRMSFDYRLRPGPCPTTNALRIMALEGLPVDESGA